jgi:hypothetical protein
MREKGETGDWNWEKQGSALKGVYHAHLLLPVLVVAGRVTTCRQLRIQYPGATSVRLLAAARQKACGDPAQRSLGI